MSISASPTPHNFTAGRFLPACRCFVGLGSAACRGWFLRGVGPHTTTDAEKRRSIPFFGKTPPSGAENGFPTQAYSSFTISALREAFFSKVTPAMRSSCTRLHPNAFDKGTNYFHFFQKILHHRCYCFNLIKLKPSGL